MTCSEISGLCKIDLSNTLKAFVDRRTWLGRSTWSHCLKASYLTYFLYFSLITIKGSRFLPVYPVSLQLNYTLKSKIVAYKVKTAFDRVFLRARDFKPVVNHSPQFRPMNAPDKTISRQNCARKESQEICTFSGFSAGEI